MGQGPNFPRGVIINKISCLTLYSLCTTSEQARIYWDSAWDLQFFGVKTKVSIVIIIKRTVIGDISRNGHFVWTSWAPTSDLDLSTSDEKFGRPGDVQSKLFHADEVLLIVMELRKYGVHLKDLSPLLIERRKGWLRWTCPCRGK